MGNESIGGSATRVDEDEDGSGAADEVWALGGLMNRSYACSLPVRVEPSCLSVFGL